MGGFTLGGFQTPFASAPSTVAAPSAGVAGSSGQGGMSVGQSRPPDEQPDVSAASGSSPSSNANVTGDDPSLASTAAQVGLAGSPGSVQSSGRLLVRRRARSPG